MQNFLQSFSSSLAGGGGPPINERSLSITLVIVLIAAFLQSPPVYCLTNWAGFETLQGDCMSKATLNGLGFHLAVTAFSLILYPIVFLRGEGTSARDRMMDFFLMIFIAMFIGVGSNEGNAVGVGRRMVGAALAGGFFGLIYAMLNEGMREAEEDELSGGEIPAWASVLAIIVIASLASAGIGRIAGKPDAGAGGVAEAALQAAASQ